MAKEIHYLDDDHNPLTAASDCKIFISNISEGFDLDLSDVDGNTIKYEVVIADGGPLLHPRRI